jgi:PAS domain S-box-containing protein
MAVIITSGVTGLAWRYWRGNGLENVSSRNLYALGIVTHLFMLLWMLTLPSPNNLNVLSKISLPALLIFPVCTVLLGKLLVNRFHRINSTFALKESEEKYRKMIGSLQEGIWVIDKDNLTTFVNTPMAKMLGYTVGEMIGKTLFSFMSEQSTDLAKQNLERRQRGIKEQHEFVLSQKDGADVIALIETQPLVDDNGNYNGAIAGVIDITERKKIEEKLLESEAKYRHLYETLTQGAVIQDADGKIIDANPAACQILGSTMDQLLGETAYDPRWRAIHKDGSPYNPAEMPSNIVLQTGKPVINAYIGIHRPDKNDYTWNLISSVPRFKDGDTKPSFTVTVFTDITTLHLAEKELVESEKRYRSLFENMAAGFVLFEVVEDDKGVPIDLIIVTANKGFEITTGLNIQDVKGKRLLRVLPGVENDDADWIGTYGKVALSGIPQKVEQASELLGYHYSVIAYQAGPKQCAVTFTDITEQKKVAREHEKLQAQLQQAQKMEAIGSLAGGVAHDYNNMLSVIVGYTELALASTELPSSVHADLEEVLSAARRSTNITRQLLAFARKENINPIVINLNDTIEEMLKMIRRLVGEDIDLAWLPDGALWSVNMDPSQIDQILVNLCVNARDAIADVGNLTIETENIFLSENYCSEHVGAIPGDFIMLAVSDDGCGMTRETIDKIFEPFFTTKLLGQGTGMGLSTVFGIVKQNGGFINVYSEPGEGTTFKIYLPRHEGEPEERGTKGGMRNQLSRGETVLVVEDEDSILQLCKRILVELGYSVLTANTPEEAIHLTKTHEKEIHLLITDVVMPMMNGQVLAKHLQSICPAIKILFMSGYTANVIAHHGVLEKGIHFVPKPLSRQILAAKVREALDERKSVF